MGGWQDAWTFRIVDQHTGAAIPGIPVTVLDDGGRSVGFWVSDVDGIVRIPKHDRARLRLRLGLRSDDTIELDAQSLPDDPVPLIAPPSGPSANVEGEPSVPAAESAPQSQATTPGHPGHILRFARIGVLPEDGDLLAAADLGRPGGTSPDPGVMRYAVLLEVEQTWQSLGTQAGDLLYSISLGPGEEVQVAVTDNRWRRHNDARDRPLQIIAKMVAAPAPLLGDGVDAVPLAGFIATDATTAATETARLLAQRTVQMSEKLHRRPLGVSEFEGEKPAGASLRTMRNMRSDGVLTYHFVEPVERYRVVTRTPHLRPAMLVPFRLPHIATREVVRRFGHALRRALLDRAYLPDIEQVLKHQDPEPASERRLYEHMEAHLSYYSATIIAAGDPAERFFALAKLRDAANRPLTDVIENIVVGRVGNYVAFPLRSLEYTTARWRTMLSSDSVRHLRTADEALVTLPIPGVWLRASLSPAQVETDPAAGEASQRESYRPGRRAERRG